MHRREQSNAHGRKVISNNYSDENFARKPENIKKSYSWIKLGDPLYSTTMENSSRNHSRHSNTKRSNQKSQSIADSDRKHKKSKSKKSISKVGNSAKKTKK